MAEGTLSVYRGVFDNDKTCEVRLLNNATLYDVTHFKKDGAISKPDSYYRPLVDQSLNLQPFGRIENCFPRRDNTTFAVTFAERKFSTVNAEFVALETALKAQIQQLKPISAGRISIAFVPSAHDDLVALITLADARTDPAAPVSSKIAETSVPDFIAVLNATIAGDNWTVKVLDAKNLTQDFVVRKQSFTAYPDVSNKADFVGFSGGSMTVLAISMFLIGVAIGAVGVCWRTNRAGIQQIAYQVFE